MLKKALRLTYKTLRKQLSEDQLEEMSLAIANKILILPIWEKSYFHIFLPIEEQNEVNTEFILHLLSGKDKEIIISKSDFETREMTHFLLTDNTKIKKRKPIYSRLRTRLFKMKWLQNKRICGLSCWQAFLLLVLFCLETFSPNLNYKKNNWNWKTNY